MGSAFAFADPEIRKELGGSLSFFAVPAEEYIDADRRPLLREKGVQFMSGKSELIRTGAFDRTDIAMTTHVHMVPVEEDFYLGNPACNGFTAERVTVRGKAAHAAVDPWNGVNALSIATSAIQMMGLMRETFREEDHVRLHNVIRKAGDVLNSVPDEAVLETKVRAASLEKIQEIREKSTGHMTEPPMLSEERSKERFFRGICRSSPEGLTRRLWTRPGNWDLSTVPYRRVILIMPVQMSGI